MSSISRFILGLVVVTALIPGFSPDLAWSEDTLSLATGWSLQSAGKTEQGGEALSSSRAVLTDWYSTEVPTTVLAALVENKVFPDPYFGDNLTRIPGYQEGRWLTLPEDSPFREPWWFRTEFDLPDRFEGKHLTLHFDGINYQANIWLNGTKVADKDRVIGMFRRFQFDVTPLCHADEKNYLAVEIIAPGQAAPENPRTKQVEATTGWDDHNPQPPDLNMGIWRGVYLSGTGAVRLAHPSVVSTLEIPSLQTADLTVSAEVSNLTDAKVTVSLEGAIEEKKFSKQAELPPHESRWVEFSAKEFPQLTVTDPRVWWPHPLGRQELYQLHLTASVDGGVSHTVGTRFGIRDATTSINPEGWREYRINGRKVLIRGGAWMTCDMLLRFDNRRYEALVRYAREGNLNMLRSEGFSIRETDEFYDLCDEYGVMVTQQLFGRSIPDEKLAIDCIEDTLLRIRNHPSLVHFLGHDETFPTPSLDLAYRELIEEYDLRRTYQPHSGAFDVNERFETGGTRTGTRELWTYAHPSKYYVGKEDGAWGFAQSGGIGGIVAPIESLRRMFPKEALWPPTNDIWSLHTVAQGVDYFDTVFEQLNLRYGQADGIEDFVRKAMLLNYECARAMFEAWGRNKYDATGITTWKYDAAWPAAMTWQYVDWYLNVGGAYYGAKKACEPLHVQYSYDDDSIYVLNALNQAFDDLRVDAHVYDINLKERLHKQAVVNVGSDGKIEALVLSWPQDLTQTFFLDLRLTNAQGQVVSTNFYWLSTAKDVVASMNEDWNDFRLEMASTPDFRLLSELPPVELSVTSEERSQADARTVVATVENPTDRLALGVHLSIRKGEGGEEVLPCYWQDNYFALLPGEKRSLEGTFSQSDLGDANPVLAVEGWNVTQK